MRRLLRAIEARDVIATVGIGLIAGGLWMVSIPIALVVTGTLLLALAVGPLVLNHPRQRTED